MAKRSITDEEIRLIKAMLKRGMKNNEIQFYFNRQDRPVNSGRITQIKNNDYGAASLAAVTDQELVAFMADFKPAEVGATMIAAQPSAPPAPSKAEIAKSLFEQKEGKWRLKDGETDQHECKQDFDPKKL